MGYPKPDQACRHITSQISIPLAVPSHAKHTEIMSTLYTGSNIAAKNETVESKPTILLDWSSRTSAVYLIF